MKKCKFIFITLITMHYCNFSIFAKSQNELGAIPVAPNIDSIAYTKKSKLKRTNPLEFQPDNAFGGPKALGKYDYKLKTATITFDNTIYNFTLVQELPNPYNDKLTPIGSFVNGITRGMPIVRYLFGQPVKNK